jgi:hypothetical protein
MSHPVIKIPSMCDCPTDDDLFHSIDQQIDARRWKLIGVGFGEQPSPTPWMYTIGLAEGFGHPELCMVGACCWTCSGSLLRALAERVGAGERFDRAMCAAVEDDLGVELVGFRPVQGSALVTSWFAAWHAYYRSKPYAPPPLEVLQVVMPDAHGWYPWDAACDVEVALRQEMPDRPPEPNRAMRRRAQRPRRHHR